MASTQEESYIIIPHSHTLIAHLHVHITQKQHRDGLRRGEITAAGGSALVRKCEGHIMAKRGHKSDGGTKG